MAAEYRPIRMSGAITRVYDSNGNLISDSEKGHAYKWDVLGRLMEIRVGGGGNDDLVAAFRYNALGHRIAEHVDLDGDGDVDADDPWTRLVYDGRWRVVATYRIDAVQDTEALHERFVYHAAGLDGLGTGSYVDALVLRDRDADGVGGNGSLEERHYYAQSWRHDVVAVIDHQGRQVEHVRYTPYGVPISIPMADKDRNGLLEQTDLDLQAAAISLPYDVRFDNDLDGDVDFTDLSLAVNQIGAITDPIGRGVLSSFGHRAGYAGYQWIPAAGFYHVRYRWYDAGNGTWLGKDPAGYMDGASLFGYVMQQPVAAIDPTGLVYYAPRDGAGGPGWGAGAHDKDEQFYHPNRNRNPSGPRDYNSPVDDIGLFLLSILCEPVDVGLGIYETWKDPANPWNWASIIPIPLIPGAVLRKGDEIVEEGTKVYRVWGDGAKPDGHSWTTVNPGTVDNYRDAAGLPSQNTGRFVSEGTLVDNTGVIRKQADPLHGNTGGLDEVVVPDPNGQINLTGVSGANPEF